jgi:hypothetical protein
MTKLSAAIIVLMAKSNKKFDSIYYFGFISLVCFSIFLLEYIKTRDECPRSGGVFYIAGVLSLVILITGLNISRMAKKGRSKWKVLGLNSMLALTLSALGLVSSFYLYFCLTF